MIVHAARASTILYNLLVARHDRRPFLLPANICPIVPLTFFKASVAFEFVDISAGTLHMNLEQAEDRLRKKPDRYGGVLYAHTYGEPSTPQDFFREVKHYNSEALVIDDRCLCAPETRDGSNSTQADALLFSTGYAKIVDLGFGGYGFVKPEVAYQPTHLPYVKEQLEQLEADYKQHLKNRRAFEYYDSDWLQTDAGLPSWDDYARRITQARASSKAHRDQVNQVYRRLIPAEVQLPEDYQSWRFNLRVPDQRIILDEIFSAGLFASAHYASLAGIMAPGDCPVAQELSVHVINLFNDHHFTPEMAEKASQIINAQV